MLKDVLITINSSQGLNDDVNKIDMTTEGKFGIKDNCYYIKYDDSKMLGIDKTETHLYVKRDNTVVIKRTGALKSCLEIKDGVRNSCFYNTSQGVIVIGLFGEVIENDLSEFGGTLNLEYTIDNNLNLISRNCVSISVRKVNNNVDKSI